MPTSFIKQLTKDNQQFGSTETLNYLSSIKTFQVKKHSHNSIFTDEQYDLVWLVQVIKLLIWFKRLASKPNCRGKQIQPAAHDSRFEHKDINYTNTNNESLEKMG